MNQTNSTLKNIVLMRVHTIALVRSIAPAYVASALLLVVSLYSLGREVFVAQVFRNMPNFFDVPAVVSFYEHAFLNTHLVVQVLSLAVLVAALWLARETGRLLALLTQSLRFA